MSEEQKKRLFQVVKPVVQVLLAGIIYVIFIKLTGWAIPCPIKLVTGKFCPGCGISRMLLAMLRLDFKGAYYANRLLFFLLPVILVYALIKAIHFIKTGKNEQRLPEHIAILIITILTIIFWVLRNTTAFSFLAPIA